MGEVGRWLFRRKYRSFDLWFGMLPAFGLMEHDHPLLAGLWMLATFVIGDLGEERFV